MLSLLFDVCVNSQLMMNKVPMVTSTGSSHLQISSNIALILRVTFFVFIAINRPMAVVKLMYPAKNQGVEKSVSKKLILMRLNIPLQSCRMIQQSRRKSAAINSFESVSQTE